MPDRRVQAAIDHWAPRFITMGVDYNDFVRTTARIERWEDWLAAWTAVAEEHLVLATEAEAAGHERSAGEAYLHAALCLHFGKFVWLHDAAAHRASTERAIEALYQAHRFLDPSAERVEGSLGGAVLAGNLRRPPGVARAPLVLLIPGLDSTKEEFFHHENAFLVRGMATMSMDGPGQGESGFALPIRPDYEVAVAAMLDALDGRSDLDLARIGAVGVSLGGYYAPRAAAFEKRFALCVAWGANHNWGAVQRRRKEREGERPVPHYWEHVLWVWGHDDLQEFIEFADQVNLDGVVEQITVPFLIAHGAGDRQIPLEYAHRSYEQAVASPKRELRVFTVEEGGAEHIGLDHLPHVSAYIADWVAGTFTELAAER